MSEKTLRFGDKKEFHASKQGIALNSVKLVKYLFLINLSTVMMVLNILLAINMVMM